MAIEMLMNANDPNADSKETMDVDTARMIANLGRVCVDSYKVKAQALAVLAKAENPQKTMAVIQESGIVSAKTLKLAEDGCSK